MHLNGSQRTAQITVDTVTMTSTIGTTYLVAMTTKRSRLWGSSAASSFRWKYLENTREMKIAAIGRPRVPTSRP